MNAEEKKLLAGLRRENRELKKKLLIAQQMEAHYLHAYVETRQLLAGLRSRLKDLVGEFE